MSLKGNCWERAACSWGNNPVAESFFHSIKTQLIHHVRFENAVEAEHTLFNCIKVYYNRQRKHSAKGYKAPALFEQQWREKGKLA